MPMTEKQIIQLLADTGHLHAPFGDTRSVQDHVDNLKIGDRAVRLAIESYQDMHSFSAESFVAKHYPRRLSAAMRVDGQLGPAMLELMEQPRCQCKDYDLPKEESYEVEEAQGSGNWRGCHGIGNFHSAIAKFHSNYPVPSFLAPHFDTIWEGVVSSYAEVGLLWTRDDNASRPNVDVYFVRPDGGWIGLAIVSNRETCSGKIWAKFDKNYRPGGGDTAVLINRWISLMKHEFGHNCGLSHSRGGVMNSYLLGGLPISWKDDVSYPLLKQRFGGEPIPRDTPDSRMAVCRVYPNGQFDVIYELPSNSEGIWPTE